MTPPGSSSVDSVATLFDVDRNRLLDLLRPLHDGEWKLPTACPRWDVLDASDRDVIARGSLSADQAWRLLTNNLDRDVDLALRGDDHIVGVFARTRATIGHANRASTPLLPLGGVT